MTTSSSFVQRIITPTFTLSDAKFSGGGNTSTLKGHRCVANIVKAGGVSMGGLQLRVYGMKDDQANQLSTLGLIPSVLKRNTVSLSVGDAQSGMSTPFEGTIVEAWADYSAAPETVFHVTAFIGAYEAAKPVDPSSYPGSVNAAQVMSDIAKKMGRTFENNGVSKILTNSYFPGTARQQADACARAGGFEWLDDNGILAIWPSFGARKSQVVTFSLSTGMVGYPTYEKGGIVVTALYNPNVRYGAQIKVESSLKPASGMWTVFGLTYSLASEMPDGDWFMTMRAFPQGYAPVF